MRRDVDRDRRDDALAVPAGGGEACIAHHLLAERADEAELFRDRDEYAGRDDRAIRATPAGQRFGADKLAGFEFHLGLEHGDELAAIDARAHFFFELRLGARLVEQALVEEGDALSAAALGFLERNFGELEQVGAGGGVGGGARRRRRRR